ncbi:MAG: LacI family DNA-binding transcriptional regulator [Anaerolineae bacterium]
MARQRVTQLDVAKRAGVSYQTVSRVINNHPNVAPATRARVEQAIRELGYQPNAIARGLASSRTRTLGLITADFSDFFFTQVIIGAEQEARRAGYFIMLGSTEKNMSEEPEYIRLFSQYCVDGFLFARPSTEADSRHLLQLIRSGIPLVTTAYYLPGEPMNVVDINNIEGGYQATRHLIELGHRRIAHITGPLNWRSANDRWTGYRRALGEAGLAYDQALVASGDWSLRSGYEAAQALLARGRRFTALFSGNDQMAIGAMRAFREAGLRIPEDVAIVGYDGIPMSEYTSPPLSTMVQPMQKVGQLAAKILIDHIEHPGQPPIELLLDATLVCRGTCGH